jgi:hypothetical protein
MLCVVLGVIATAPAVALGAREPLPALAPLAIFGLLHAFAENQAAGDDHVMQSAGFMLCMAAIVVFRDTGSPLGPMLVGVAGCLDVRQIRDREWRKILFNGSMFGLATLAGAVVFYALAGSGPHDAAFLLLLALPAALAFSVVNMLVLASVLVLVADEGFSSVFVDVFRGQLQIYPFAVLGVFLGQLYLDYGVLPVPLFVVPIMVARQAFAAYLALKAQQEATVRTLIAALEAKDPYTAGHAERVAGYAQRIGSELGMTPARLERLRLAALMHDVGKLVVPNHLLNKKGKLTAEEFARVRQHEDVSVQILTRIDFLAPVAPSATSEAAAFSPVADDRGQPIEPHIVAVADAFDAMTSTRSYRKALPQDVAFQELRKNSGKQFHPRVVDALITAIHRRGEVHGAGHETEIHHADAPEAGTGSAGLGDLLADPVDETASGGS